jgi:hypothetical protein
VPRTTPQVRVDALSIMFWRMVSSENKRQVVVEFQPLPKRHRFAESGGAISAGKIYAANQHFGNRARHLFGSKTILSEDERSHKAKN